MARMSDAEREYANRFREAVRRKRPVLGLGLGYEHLPFAYVVDPHHVIKAQTLRDFVVPLDTEEGWRIIWNPDNGIPVTRPLHDRITNGSRRLFAWELRPENRAFAKQLGIWHLLEREIPTLERETVG